MADPGMMRDQKKVIMTPEQALEFLDSCTGDVQAIRRDHDMIKHSVQILVMTVAQWRALQDPAESTKADDPEDPKKLLTEG